MACLHVNHSVPVLASDLQEFLPCPWLPQFICRDWGFLGKLLD